MAGRGLGIWIAVFYVLPMVLAVEAALQPRAAWQAVDQRRVVWLGIFLGGPVISMVTKSQWPALGTVILSFAYMARIRSSLLIGAGIERERRRRGPAGEP
jgi:hypothetical protein